MSTRKMMIFISIVACVSLLSMLLFQSKFSGRMNCDMCPKEDVITECQTTTHEPDHTLYPIKQKGRSEGGGGTALSKLIIEKFERGLKIKKPNEPFRALIHPSVGGFCNNLRGLVTNILFCIFSDCVPLVHNGIGRNHKGNMLDYMSARDERLQKLLRYENHEKDEEWARGGLMYDKDAFFKIYETNDPSVQKNVESAKEYKYILEVDGEFVHYCESNVCNELKNRGNVRLLKTSRGTYIDTEIGMLETLTPEDLDLDDRESSKFKDSVRIYANNNLYTPFVFNDPNKIEILCELGLCDGLNMGQINQELLNNYDEYPIVGFPYLGSKLAGNILRDLFTMSPRIKPQFDEFVNKNVKGTLIGLQVRSHWMKSTWEKKIPLNPFQVTPGWDEWKTCLKEMILNEISEVVEGEITVFIACDREVPDSFIRSVKYLDNRIQDVLTSKDYPFDHETFVDAESFEFAMQDSEEAVIATVYDYFMLAKSDYSIITFMSSFGQMTAAACGKHPPYVMFHEDVLPNPNMNVCVKQPRIYSFWYDRWKEVLGLDWLLDITSLGSAREEWVPKIEITSIFKDLTSEVKNWAMMGSKVNGFVTFLVIFFCVSL